VTLPPGRAKLATKPIPTGSFASAKTIGMIDVACRVSRLSASRLEFDALKGENCTRFAP
jgi:hypothetical protein